MSESPSTDGSIERWRAVDAYFDGRLLGEDPALSAALSVSEAEGLPAISVYPAQGKLLHLLALGSQRILEVGTLGGYSTIWLARALGAGGRLVTCEIDPHHAEVAGRNLAAAGVADQVDVAIGPAVTSLQQLIDDGAEPFDFVFIDADKPSNAEYVRLALSLTRPGSMIIVDNVVRRGEILADFPDANAAGVHRVVKLIASEPRLSATAVQTVSGKGWDGMILARVTS